MKIGFTAIYVLIECRSSAFKHCFYAEEDDESAFKRSSKALYAYIDKTGNIMRKYT